MQYFKVTRDCMSHIIVAVENDLERAFFETVNPRGYYWDRIEQPNAINFTVRTSDDLMKHFN